MTVTLSINGADPVSAASLGWSAESMARRNAAPDVVMLKRVRAAGMALDITEGTQVVVFVDGQRTFTGVAQAAQLTLGEQGSRVAVPVFGPWWHLMQVNFCRAELHLEGSDLSLLPPEEGTTFTTPGGSGAGTSVWNGSAWVAGGAGTVYQWARQRNLSATPKQLDIADFVGARGLLFDPNWPASPNIYRTVYTEVSELLTYMLEVHERLGLAAPFQVDLVQLETDLGTTATPRYRSFTDQRVSSMLSMALSTKPDAAVFFDYSTEIPTLRIRVASIETETVLTTGGAPLQRLSVTPRPELKPKGFIVRWEDPSVSFGTLTPLYRGYKRPYYLDKYPASILPHEPGVAIQTLDYDSDGSIATFKPQLAQSLYESVSILRATGSMSLTLPDPQAAAQIRPGLTYRLAGDPALEDVQLLVQDVTWNIEAGTVECTLGYPRTLDLQTLSDLKGWITYTMEGFLSSTTSLIPPPPPS